jgi:hypothetical protein
MHVVLLRSAASAQFLYRRIMKFTRKGMTMSSICTFTPLLLIIVLYVVMYISLPKGMYLVRSNLGIALLDSI